MDPRVLRGEAVELAGARVQDGDTVLVLFGAANRDPQQFADPSRFDIHREPRRHPGFGFGPHSCLGLNLARLEVRTLMTRLLDRFPGFGLAEPVTDYGDNFSLRGPARVPIRLAERA